MPRAVGGEDEDRNLITLCHGCHGRAHGVVRRDVRALTKTGLAAAKARGTKLGGDRGKLHLVRDAGRAAGIAVRQARASGRAIDLAPIIAELRAEGRTTLAALADGLNSRGIPAAWGGVWTPMQVSRVLKRAAA